MLSWLRGIIAGAPRRKARRLERDARTVVQMVRQTYRESAADAIALQLREALAGTDAVEADAAALERWGGRLRSLHSEARRAQEQIGLTAFTLAIIDLQARSFGPDGVSARAVVDDFLADPFPGGGPDGEAGGG